MTPTLPDLRHTLALFIERLDLDAGSEEPQIVSDYRRRIRQMEAVQATLTPTVKNVLQSRP